MWLSQIASVQKLPVVHSPELVPHLMARPVLGVVLHTTNSPLGAQTPARFQNDFTKSGPVFRSAHFIVDQTNETIPQYRDTDVSAPHIALPPHPHSLPIHHTPHPQPLLTPHQPTT